MKRQEEEINKKYGLNVQKQQKHQDSDMEVEISPLDVPPSTPIVEGNLPLKELGIPNEAEEEVLYLTILNFDQVNCNIIQERKKYYARNPTKPLIMTIEKVIILDTMVNLEMIISTENALVTTIELNMGRMSKKIANIQGKKEL